MIVSDDQAYTDFGFMGNERVHTPNLDRLASRSARYTYGYVPSSVCRPSLVSMLTGLYPHEHGVHFNHPPPGFSNLTKSPEIDKQAYDQLRERGAQLITRLPTLPREFAKHGYRCFQTGKYWEGHWRNAGFTEGMTISEPSGGKYGDKQLPNGQMVAHGNGDHGLAIGRETMQPITDFLRDVDDSPFFLWYAPFLPHTPHDSPQRFVDLAKAKPSVAAHELPYFAAIAQFDETVGNLLSMIQQRGLTNNTLFVLVVDNGWQPDPKRFVAKRREWDHTSHSKRAPFDAGLRTPILLSWQGRTKPATHEQPVSSIDIMPTLLAGAGIPTDKLELSGHSLWQNALGEGTLPEDRPIFGEIYPGDAIVLGDPARDVAYRWVRKGAFKLIMPHAHGNGNAWGKYLSQPAMYNVLQDPSEIKNLINSPDQTNTLSDLRGELDRWWNP